MKVFFLLRKGELCRKEDRVKAVAFRGVQENESLEYHHHYLNMFLIQLVMIIDFVVPVVFVVMAWQCAIAIAKVIDHSRHSCN